MAWPGNRASLQTIRTMAQGVIEARGTGRPLTTDEEEFVDWLLGKAAKWTDEIGILTKKLSDFVGRTTKQGEAARILLQSELAEYSLMTPEQRQKAKDRFYRALVERPRSEAPPSDIDKISVGGHDFQRPTRFSGG